MVIFNIYIFRSVKFILACNATFTVTIDAFSVKQIALKDHTSTGDDLRYAITRGSDGKQRKPREILLNDCQKHARI